MNDHFAGGLLPQGLYRGCEAGNCPKGTIGIIARNSAVYRFIYKRQGSATLWRFTDSFVNPGLKDYGHDFTLI